MENSLTLNTPSPSALSRRTNARMKRQMARKIEHIIAIAEVTKSGASKIGEISSYVSFEASRSLVTMNLMEQVSGLSPQDREALAALKQCLCDDLEEVASLHHDRIIAILQNLPLEQKETVWDQIADFLGI